jgi:hypothetical protein
MSAAAAVLLSAHCMPMLMVCLHACNTSACCELKLFISVTSFVLLQPDEYEKLGSYALIGLPDDYKTK